jgi:hypothetical protein
MPCLKAEEMVPMACVSVEEIGSDGLGKVEAVGVDARFMHRDGTP